MGIVRSIEYHFFIDKLLNEKKVCQLEIFIV